ncbi:MAG TPA: lipid-A-disaccharide synthase [Vicinamibacterales bacterium]|nr:lipid-A-disaccharide synthase [Vicinamibacterales bacterium]
MRVLLSSGEASGDLYAGALVRELRAISPDVEVFGLGGPQFVAAGGRQIADYRDLSVNGLFEVLGKIPKLAAARAHIVRHADATPPDVFVPIDFWGFNYRLAQAMHTRGVPVVYYISPQLWASRPWRMASLRAIAARVLVIFPFEEAIYQKAGVPVEFVGHPLVEMTRAAASGRQFLEARGLSAASPTVAVLPGSRANEVSRILPGLVAAAGIIRASLPDAQFLVARAPNLANDLFHPLEQANLAKTVLVDGDTDTVLAASDVALLASGTATVQAALHDTPMVIVYRVSPLTYALGRWLLTVDTFGMPNLIAGHRIVPELIQHDFTPERVAREAVSMLTDAHRAAQIREGLREVRHQLGSVGASHRAAQAILRQVRLSVT